MSLLCKGISNYEAKLLLEDVSDGLVIVDDKGKIKYYNQTFRKLFLEDDDLRGKSIEEVLLKGQEANKEMNAFAESIWVDDEKKKITVPYKLSNGEILHLLFDVRKEIVEECENEEKIAEITMIVEDVTEHYRNKLISHDSANIFTGLIISIFVYVLVWSYLKFTLRIQLNTVYYTYMIEFIAVILFLEVLFFTSFSMRDVGLRIDKTRILSNVKKTAIIAGVSVGVLLLLRCGQIVFNLGGKPYFIGGTWRGCTKYILTALLQEFLARGVIQTAVKYLLQIKHQRGVSLIVTSLIFALMHIPFGAVFMIGAGLLSYVLGWIYEDQGSIWGCAFIHWSVGYVAMSLFF